MSAPEFSRAERIARSIRRELAPLLQQIARDRRLGLVTVTAVEVSPDYRHADVYVTRLGGSADSAAIVAELEPELARCRRQIARTIRMRQVPRLRFRHDAGPATAARVAELLREPKTGGQTDSNSSA